MKPQFQALLRPMIVWLNACGVTANQVTLAAAIGSVRLGFLGGLMMSAIKRDQGIRDWGDTIAGHGGFLDRTEAIIFAAPIFFHLTRYWFTV